MSTTGATNVEPPPGAEPDHRDPADRENVATDDINGDIDDDDDDDEIVVLPWWYNPINLIAVAIGLILVMGSLGWVLGNNHAQPDPNATDVGFLQDMRWHHEQAVLMSFIFISDRGVDQALYQEAQEIIVGQNLEIGQMVELLRSFGKPEAAPTDTGMAWMGEPTPLDQMPGMATDADLDKLGTLSGAAANTMFVDLMVAHHQGGIHMADFATTHADETTVRDLADSISGSQAEEITELQQLL
ncbi:MAG: DUF305 domain-containing protein, partial [Ilumatobacteraceae bacterium]